MGVDLQVSSACGKFRCELVERWYRFNVGQLMGEVRGSLK